MAVGTVRALQYWPLVVATAVSFLLVYVFSPESIRSIPGIEAYLHWAVTSIPAIQEHITSSRFPEVAYIYFPLMLVMSPLHFLHVWQTTPRAVWDEKFAKQPVTAFAQLLFVLALTALLAYGSVWLGVSQLKIFPWNDSEFALALIGQFISGGAFFGFLAVFARAAKGFLKRSLA